MNNPFLRMEKLSIALIPLITQINRPIPLKTKTTKTHTRRDRQSEQTCTYELIKSITDDFITQKALGPERLIDKLY